MKEQLSSAKALHRHESRSYSALPEYVPDYQHDSEAAEHSRRLREMEQASTKRSNLPSTEEVKQRLQSHSTASCSSSPSEAQQSESSPSLDWREVVYQLRQLQWPAEQIRDQMLTDTFGQALTAYASRNHFGRACTPWKLQACICFFNLLIG